MNARKRNIGKSAYAYSNFMDYAKYFTDSGFKDKLLMLAGLVGKNILLPVLRLYYVLKSPTTSTKSKLYIAGALGYFICPFDVIPDVLGPLIGYTDDLAVVALVMRIVAEEITDEIEESAQKTYHRLARTVGVE